MPRGLIGPLALLLMGPALALAQTLPPPPSSAAPVLPGPAMPSSSPTEIGAPGPGVLGPAFTQPGSAFPYLWWARAEYLSWWVKDGPAPPPLVTTGPLSAAHPAVLGQPGTETIFGGQPINYGTSAGGRWTFGSWCDAQQCLGWELTGFLLEQPSQTPAAFSSATGTPVLGRPFVSIPNGGPSSLYVAYPNRFSGSVDFVSNSQLWGVETLCVKNAIPWEEFGPVNGPHGVYRLDMLGGFRYLDLLEDLAVNQNSTLLADGVANFQGATALAPDSILVSDRFVTHNMFYGAEVGARAEFVHGSWFLNLSGKLAVGGERQTIITNGASTLIQPLTQPGVANVVGGGLLATATNIGRRSRERFAVVPELGLNFGYQFCEQVRLFAGYSFIYWSSVARPGDQIDPVVNVTQVPIHPSYGPLTGAARPVPLFQESSFWAQGINLGVEIRF